MTTQPNRIDRALADLPGLDPPTKTAVKLAALVWLEARHSPALDSPQHWDRFATRIESAAYSSDMPGLLKQVCRRFELARPGVETTTFALSLDTQRAREVLSVWRQHAGQVTDLVRYLRETGALKDSDRGRQELAQPELTSK